MQFKALVFADASDQYHHGNVPVAKEAFEMLSEKHFFSLSWVDSAEAFAGMTFADYDVIVFVSARPLELDAVKRAELKAYVHGGGGVVGVHFSITAEPEAGMWPWWDDVMGQVFLHHPPRQSAVMHVEAPDFPACLHLPEKWLWTDEWYDFEMPFPDHLKVILTVDESTYYPKAEHAMGDHHPVAWHHEFEGGRVFYTSLGHIAESYRDPVFLQHVFGGILWAVGPRDPKW